MVRKRQVNPFSIALQYLEAIRHSRWFAVWSESLIPLNCRYRVTKSGDRRSSIDFVDDYQGGPILRCTVNSRFVERTVSHNKTAAGLPNGRHQTTNEVPIFRPLMKCD